jgi:hypothetical protein
VQDQGAGLGFQQQVLGAPPGAANGAAIDLVDSLHVHGPAQARFVHLQPVDAPADDMRLDAAARGFDFG